MCRACGFRFCRHEFDAERASMSNKTDSVAQRLAERDIAIKLIERADHIETTANYMSSSDALDRARARALHADAKWLREIAEELRALVDTARPQSSCEYCGRGSKPWQKNGVWLHEGGVACSTARPTEEDAEVANRITEAAEASIDYENANFDDNALYGAILAALSTARQQGADGQFRAGLEAAAKVVCHMCADPERYTPPEFIPAQDAVCHRHASIERVDPMFRGRVAAECKGAAIRALASPPLVQQDSTKNPGNEAKSV